MAVMMKLGPIISFLWTLLSLASSLPILAMVLGSAAWNGVNFAVGSYLFLSAGGVAGLLVGFVAAFSRKKLLGWITCVSAGTIAGLSALFACSLLLDRSRGVPLSGPVIIGGVHASMIVFYGVAFVCCCLEALLYFPKTENSPAL
jgi:hypothetical protein